MSQDLAIEISNLRKIYYNKGESNIALESIDLNIKKNSIFALLGPNGAGKSTIINILAGITKKTSGIVKISNFDIDKHNSEAKSRIGIVPQELIIDPFFNVYDALEIYAGYYGVRKKDRKTSAIIDALGLNERIKSEPRSLSGGMKRRLLVGKALVHNPEVLILDEPTAGVDVELREQLWNYIKKLNRDNGTTIVLTTHYIEEAEALCDEIAIIDNGKIVKCDKKDNLMKILDKKSLDIYLKNPISDDFILNNEKFDITVINNGQINISYKSKDIDISEILSILYKNHIEFTDISTNKSNLEDIFRFIIKK